MRDLETFEVGRTKGMTYHGRADARLNGRSRETKMIRRTMRVEKVTVFPHLAAFGVPLVGVPLLWALLTFASPAAPGTETTVGHGDEPVAGLMEPDAAVQVEPAPAPESLGETRI